MSSPNFSLQEARQTDIVGYLEKLGYQPEKISNNDYWYLSPLRNEKQASFKVNRKLNAWYDHGLGKGGNIIDFGTLYHKCSIPEFIQKLSQSFSFHRKTLSVQQPPTKTQSQPEALEPTIKVIAAKPLNNPALCRYLQDRKISLEVAKTHCKEVDFELKNKTFFAIGFENKSGGFELRNQYFKGSNSPKDVTLISFPTAKELAVFEGFISFLSYQTLHPQVPSLTNFLILNSLSFLDRSRQIMEKNEKVYLYLDRDEAGIKFTQTALKWNTKYTDRSDLYKNHKDINDYLMSQNRQLTQHERQRQHL